MSVGLNYIKMPRNVSEYTLMKGVTDYSNLKQFDLYETGYSFLTVVSVPRYMQLLAAQDAKVKNLQDGFVHILEGEFRGLDGIPDITADAGTVTNGVNELQVINNVSMDTSIQVSMSFFERSGSLLTNYLSYYLTGIKDPYSKAKTYHGLIEKPAEISMSEFVKNDVDIPDTLPKDQMLELTQIQLEMKLGLECRHGALKRLGRENIQDILDEVDQERKEHPEYFGGSDMGDQTNINAGGMMNGTSPIETVRKEMTGSNGMTSNMN